MPDQSIALWKKLLALTVFLAIVACVVVFHSRIGPDFWPIDNSRVGPNLVAAIVQGAVIFVLVVLLYPPLRRRVHRFVDVKLDGVKAHFDRHHRDLHARLDTLEAHHAKHAADMALIKQQLGVKDEAQDNDPQAQPTDMPPPP